MRKYVIGILSILFCAVIVAGNPTEASAASKSDRQAFRAVFDADYYYDANPDVAAAYGKDTEALFNHFMNFGLKEGRNASASFNVHAYRARYADLQAAFGNNMAEYCRHYIAFGIAEGRDASADGNVCVPVASMEETAQFGACTATTTATTSNSGDVIGTYTTNYTDNVPRATNVELAAARINGTVVQPGQSFSFSRTVLPRTSANGYVEAPVFISGRTGMGIGGGICQVSSTLYAAMLNAGLPATERHAHSLQVDYMPAGLDATISGNAKDLKFTNIYSQPLLIQATAENGVVTITLVLQ